MSATLGRVAVVHMEAEAWEPFGDDGAPVRKRQPVRSATAFEHNGLPRGKVGRDPRRDQPRERDERRQRLGERYLGTSAQVPQEGAGGFDLRPERRGDCDSESERLVTAAHLASVQREQHPQRLGYELHAEIGIRRMRPVAVHGPHREPPPADELAPRRLDRGLPVGRHGRQRAVWPRDAPPGGRVRRNARTSRKPVGSSSTRAPA